MEFDFKRLVFLAKRWLNGRHPAVSIQVDVFKVTGVDSVEGGG